MFPSVEEPQGGYHWLCACPRCRGIWVTQYYDILLPFPPCGPVFENFNLLPHYSVIRNIIEVLLFLLYFLPTACDWGKGVLYLYT